MKNRPFFLTLSVLSLSLPALAGSIFVPENGKYIYRLDDIKHVEYVTLKKSSSEFYKLDKRRNEYQVKDWFQHDWFLMQDMFELDQEAFIQAQKATTFNEAKRIQYSQFLFDKKEFFHYKSAPAMKEWGGLTHPPVKKLTLPLEQYDKNFGKRNEEALESAYFDSDLQQEVDRVSRSELTFKNDVHVLADHDAFLKKLSLIKGAKESILMSSLVFVCDTGTKEIVAELIKKHEAGVDVRILIDGTVGKLMGHTECPKILSAAGIPLMASKDFFKHKLKAIYHTKTLIVDLKEAVAGGHNMIDADALSRGTDFSNRDVDLYVKGPLVTDIAKQFVENWRYQAGLRKGVEPLLEFEEMVKAQLLSEKHQGLRGVDQYASILGNKESRMRGVCRFIKQAPYEDGHTITKAYLKLLDVVKEHLVITDPVKSDTFIKYPWQKPESELWDSFEYFNKLHTKVQDLARKGLPIDYITTNITMAGNENVAIMNETIKDQLGRGKKIAANWSLAKLLLSNDYYGKPHYANLLKDWLPHKSVHIWTHMSFMHSKVFYFDRIAASVGSLNFQHNATDQAYESTSVCMDKTLNDELDHILVQDMANSIPLIFSRLR